MKQLLLIRHAKTGRPEDVADFDRPLTERGQEDAELMADEMADELANVQRLLSSPAIRAWTTAQLLAPAMPGANITSLPGLYTFDCTQELAVLLEWTGDEQIIAVVGHNPATQMLAEMLTGQTIERVPTCSVLQVKLAIDSWCQLKSGCGELLRHSYPSLFRE